jgi:hypothetical protein
MQTEDFDESNPRLYENTVKVTQDPLFVSVSEFSAVALQSLEKSIILAEAVGRNRESRKRSWIVEIFERTLSALSICAACSDATADVSVVFTPNGPLVYHWRRTRFEPQKSNRPINDYLPRTSSGKPRRSIFPR